MSKKEPYVTIEPCKSDITLHCCGEKTGYWSSMDEPLYCEHNKDGIIRCRICDKKYKVKNITAELEEVQ